MSARWKSLPHPLFRVTPSGRGAHPQCGCFPLTCVCAQLRPALFDPLDCSSSVHGISQARLLEQVAVFYSRESSGPRNQTRISCIGRWILYPKTVLAGRSHIIC